MNSSPAPGAVLPCGAGQMGAAGDGQPTERMMEPDYYEIHQWSSDTFHVRRCSKSDPEGITVAETFSDEMARRIVAALKLTDHLSIEALESGVNRGAGWLPPPDTERGNTAIRAELNRLHKLLSATPPRLKCVYQLSVPGILNAYREGDISFDDAISKLALAEVRDA